MIKGPDVVGVVSDGMAVDCLTLQLDSGETDGNGRPVIGMQRGMADTHRETVDQWFALSALSRLSTTPLERRAASGGDDRRPFQSPSP